MIATRIGIVLCRVAAAVLVVQAIRSLGYTIPALLDNFDGFDADVWLFMLMTFIPGLAAIGLWIFANRICALPNSLEADGESGPLRNIDILLVGTSLIGVYLLISGIIYGVNVEVSAWMISGLYEEHPIHLDQQQLARAAASRASYVIEIVIGIALIFGRDQISRILSRARYAGTGAS